MNTRAYLSDMLHWTRIISLKAINDWPTDKATFQTGPEDNHLLWTLGHLASTDAWVGATFKIPGAEVPEAYSALFGMGSKPVNDPSKYPPLAEVRGYFDGCRSAVRNWLDTVDDKTLAGSLKEQTGGFANDGFDMLMKICWHEGWHIGQVATIRRALGLPSIM
jgi:hypothetical protein